MYCKGGSLVRISTNHHFLIFLVYYIFALILLKGRILDEQLSFSYIIIYPIHAIVNLIIGGVKLSQKEHESASGFFLADY